MSKMGGGCETKVAKEEKWRRVERKEGNFTAEVGMVLALKRRHIATLQILQVKSAEQLSRVDSYAVRHVIHFLWPLNTCVTMLSFDCSAQ